MRLRISQAVVLRNEPHDVDGCLINRESGFHTEAHRRLTSDLH